MLEVSPCGLSTPFFPFGDKDKRIYLKASFQPQVRDCYHTVLPCRDCFKENHCHTQNNLFKRLIRSPDKTKSSISMVLRRLDIRKSFFFKINFMDIQENAASEKLIKIMKDKIFTFSGQYYITSGSF